MRAGRVEIPGAELSWRFSRSPGPGGQSVNTADSRVELSFDLAASTALPPMLQERAMRALHGRLTGGVLTVTASEHRAQPDVSPAHRGHGATARAAAADQAHPWVQGAQAHGQEAAIPDEAAAPP